MKSMFYGGAVAAVVGLIMGAGFKTPSDAFDVRGAQEPQAYIQNADFSDDTAQQSYATPSGYQPEYLNGVAYAPADFQPMPAAQPETYATPAVYTADDAQDAPAQVTYASLDESAPAPAPRVTRSEGPAAEPQPVDQSQGFAMVDAPADPS